MMWMLMRMRMLVLITGLRNHQLAIRDQLAIQDQVRRSTLKAASENTEITARAVIYNEHPRRANGSRCARTLERLAMRCACACISAREMSAWGG